jgi:glutamyl-tRNA reductase
LRSEGLAQRGNAAAQAEVIIENQDCRIHAWLDGRALVPTIRALRTSGARAPHALDRAHRHSRVATIRSVCSMNYRWR